jgi:hypothetical protein
VEAFPGPIIEPGSDGVTTGLREAGHAGSLGQVLSDEAVGVLAGAALPRVVRSGEVEAGAGLVFEVGVAVELGSVVGGDRANGQIRVRDQGDRGSVELGDGTGVELSDHEMSGGSLDEGDDAGLSVADDGVDLPVSDFLSGLDG